MTLISLSRVPWGKTAGQQSGQGLAVEPQWCESLFGNANVAVCVFIEYIHALLVFWKSPGKSLQSLRRPQASSWDVLRMAGFVHPTQSGLESISGADGRVGWLPGCSRITWINLGKRDAVSLFNRNVKYGRASQAWILDESAPAKWFKAGKPCEWSQRFSSHWTRSCNSKVLLISLQVWHLDFSRFNDQVSWWTLVFYF